jgi:type IV pilus assembly protein PilY1
LGNGIQYLENDPTNSTKTYGLDGQITVWREENHEDADPNIEASEGDHVYLYINMRRGGGQYYALDVTDRQNPTLMWQIAGRAGDFLDLAQTWSAPKLANVQWDCTAGGTGCSTRTVLLFGGGYDTAHDTATSVTTNDAGAAVFMVDAVTGDLLWSAGRPNSPGDDHDLELAEMDNSIPADLTLVDTTNDGYLDIFFGVDVVGNVWRFDINDAPTGADDFATGGRIALLGDHDTDSSNDAANFRRFFYAPDVAFFAPRGGRAFFSISMTSGYRAHPRDATVTDRVYVLFDQNVFDVPRNEDGDVDYATLDDTDADPLDESDLFDATSTLADRHTTAPHGWYKTFQGANEKGLARSTTFNRSLLFTTYLPTSGASVCGASIGSGRTYVVNALTGGGLIEDSFSGAFAEYMDLMHVGIPAAPVIIFTDASETYTDAEGIEHTNIQYRPIVCVGSECFDDLLEDAEPVSRTYWRENS